MSSRIIPMGPKGWECPKCGGVYAPWVSECPQCSGGNSQQWPEGPTYPTTGDPIPPSPFIVSRSKEEPQELNKVVEHPVVLMK